MKGQQKISNHFVGIVILKNQMTNLNKIEQLVKDGKVEYANFFLGKDIRTPGDPLDKDTYHLSEEELAKVKSVPSSLPEAIDALKKESSSSVLENIKMATEALSTEMQKIGEYMSKNPSTGSGQATNNPQQTTGEPEVKDAEVKEEKPDNENPNV